MTTREDREGAPGASERPTRPLADGEFKRYRPAYQAVRQDSVARPEPPAPADFTDLDLPDEIGGEIGDEIADELPSAAPSRRRGLTAEVGLAPAPTLRGGARPDKRTIHADRPALAGTGHTESYSADRRAGIRAEVEAARRAKGRRDRPRALPTGGRVVVHAAARGTDTTLVGGGGDGSVPRPRVQPCRLLGRARAGWVIERPDGHAFTLHADRVLGVGVGVLLGDADPAGWLPVLDLITNWGRDGEGPVVLRLAETSIRWAALGPRLAPGEAGVLALAREVAGACGARVLGELPSRPPLRRFVSSAALEIAWYGRARG